jgi:hypothetical protein
VRVAEVDNSGRATASRASGAGEGLGLAQQAGDQVEVGVQNLLLPLLVSPVEERKVRWGVTSPIYQSKVLGEFPDISDDTLISPK